MNGNEDKQAYDRGVSQFSPKGRIYQVEYARKAVESGAPTIGIETEDGVVLATLTKTRSSLAKSTQKLHKVEESIGAATTGFVPDGRRLVDDLRVATQQNQLRYGEDAQVEFVAKKLADMLQESTQRGGQRPFGASLIIGGVDKTGPTVYSVGPAGTPREWKAVAEGRNRNEYIDFFESEYEDDMTLEDGRTLAFDAFREVSTEEITPQTVGIANVPTEDEQYYELSEDDIEEYI